MNTLAIITAFLLGLLLNNFLPSYVSKKGENLATKEDIAQITKEIEEVKTLYQSYYDLSKAEKEFYSEMVIEIEGFLSKIRRKQLDEKITIDRDAISADPEIHKDFLNFIDAINIILSKSFVFLGEENYSNLKEAIVPDKITSFADLRLDLLNAMRKSLYPETEIDARSPKNDLREFYYDK